MQMLNGQSFFVLKPYQIRTSFEEVYKIRAHRGLSVCNKVG